MIIRTAGELGIKYLTLYAFSVENWNRPKDEVDALMKYLVHYLKNETSELNKNNVRLEVIGQIYRLPEAVTLPMRPEYVGCKSWVTLEQPLSTVGAVPAVPEEEFIRRREAVLGFKNAPQLGQVGSFGLAHAMILTPAPKTRQLKSACFGRPL